MSSFIGCGADTPPGSGGWPPHVQHAGGNGRLSIHIWHLQWQISWAVIKIDAQPYFLFQCSAWILAHNQNRRRHEDRIPERMHAGCNSPDKKLFALRVWWNNLADRKSPMLSGISVVGSHCIALYQPLRGFYCDLHINEYLSVCSHYHLWAGQCSFSGAAWSLW